MKRILTLLLIVSYVSLGLINELKAQKDIKVNEVEIEEISCDRPGQAESVDIVPFKRFQLESGISTEHIQDKSDLITYPTMLFRYGLLKDFELRFILTNSSLTSTDFSDNSREYSGINPLVIGMKVKIAEEDGAVPAIAFLGYLGIPKSGSQDFDIDSYAPSFKFSFEHNLSEDFSLGYNIGANWNGISIEPEFIYTFGAAYSISKKFGCFVELYGFIPQRLDDRHKFDGGFTYLLSNNVMIDISGGVGLSDSAEKYFAGFGLSFRLMD